jgi:hypothetical protein
MEIIALATVEYRDKGGEWVDCTVRFKLIRKGQVGVWEEIKLRDTIDNEKPNYAISFKRDRLRVIDSKKGWFEDGVGRLKVKFQESDLSNYIGDKR